MAGVGARTALAVLSGLSVPDLADAVARQETGRLTKIPGIGKKTAERLLLELKDKMGIERRAGCCRTQVAAVSSDVLHALIALGYNEREALAAMKIGGRRCQRCRRHQAGTEGAVEGIMSR